MTRVSLDKHDRRAVARFAGALWSFGLGPDDTVIIGDETFTVANLRRIAIITEKIDAYWLRSEQYRVERDRAIRPHTEQPRDVQPARVGGADA